MGLSLIRGKAVVCRALDDETIEVIDEGAVVQQDGRIVAVGSYAELVKQYQPDQVLGSPHHVILPGFVNSHHHVGLTPLQLGSLDYPLELWFATRLGARQVDVYLDTLYSAFEMIASGITTVQHIHTWRNGPASQWPAIAEQVIQAYQDIGMRVSYSFAARDQNRLAYEADEAFIQRLPADLAPAVTNLLKDQQVPFAEYLNLFAHLWHQWQHHPSGQVKIQLAPANLHWCSDQALLQQHDYAQKYQVPVHMHLVETIYQKIYAQRRTGKTAVQHLQDLGLLGPHLTLGHGVWLTEGDIEILADTGTHICHNASSNLRLQSGIAPLNAFTRKGISVAIGLDEAGINDDRDMLQEMRLVLKLHRVPGFDAPVPKAAQVFRMATEYGAKTTGFGDRIGILAPGKAADLVLLDWRKLAYPYLDAAIPLIEAVLHRGRTTAIDVVIINGEVVLQDGQFTRVDRDAALVTLAEQLQAPLTAAEEHRRWLAKAVFPYVKQGYDGWLSNASSYPFYCQNCQH